MPWWGWILIAIGVVVIAILKLKVWAILFRKKTRKQPNHED